MSFASHNHQNRQASDNSLSVRCAVFAVLSLSIILARIAISDTTTTTSPQGEVALT